MQVQHSFVQNLMHSDAISKLGTACGEVGGFLELSSVIGYEISQLGLHAYSLPLTSLASIVTTNCGVEVSHSVLPSFLEP